MQGGIFIWGTPTKGRLYAIFGYYSSQHTFKANYGGFIKYNWGWRFSRGSPILHKNMGFAYFAQYFRETTVVLQLMK